MKKRRLILKEKKKISKECWNLDYEFFKWLDIRLKTYLKDANKVVDLLYSRFDVNGEQLTQKDIIERMIVLLDEIKKIDNYEESYDIQTVENYKELDKLYKDKIKELCNLWGIVLPSMWW